MNRVVPTLAVCIGACLVGAPALAQAGSDRDAGTLAVTFENDWFGGTDRNYTNGVRLAYTGGEERPDAVAGLVADLVTGQDETASVRRSLALGHSLFTPRDTDVAEPLPDQHPYGAYAYGEYAVLIERPGRADIVGLEVGIVGPSAGGEWVQNEVHDVFGTELVDGWDNQINDELGVTLSYDRLTTHLTSEGQGGLSGLGFDLASSFGASLGNVRTNARAGLTVRAGNHLSSGFGPPRVSPALAGAGHFEPTDGLGWYVFAGIQARAVAHDIFLDGSLLDDGDPSVDSEFLVADLQVGAAAQLGGVQLAYTYVRRSEQFETQREAQRFGAVSLSVRF